MTSPRRPLVTAPRFTPLLGAAIGAVGGGVYWLGAQLWPTSVAVVLSMAASALMSAAMEGSAEGAAWSASAEGAGGANERSAAAQILCIVFAVFIKYNALMALSAASLPYPLPANLALGLIMIAAHAASRALAAASKPSPSGDFLIASGLGFAPAALIGMPGLIGLVAAILARIALIAWSGRRLNRIAAANPGVTQPLTEICFYLGAAAARTYV